MMPTTNDPPDDHDDLPVFVYGTLRPGRPNADRWKGLAHPWHDGAAELWGFRLVSNGYFPYAIPARSELTKGCLLVPEPDCGAELLASLDQLEGVPTHYQRIAVWVMIPDLDAEGEARAWTYISPDHAHLRPVPGNDWNREPHARWATVPDNEEAWQFDEEAGW